MKMKTNCSFFTALLFPMILIFIACEGPQGPSGPEGPSGPPGPTILPASFDFTADLSEDNEFEAFMDIPDEIEVLDSDIVIAYVLEDYIEEDDLEIWRQLPVTDFTDEGTRIMNFDFTFVDVRIFLDADYQLGPNDEFFELLFRAVHIPADFANDLNASQLQSAQSPQELEQLINAQIQSLGKIE